MARSALLAAAAVAALLASEAGAILRGSGYSSAAGELRSDFVLLKRFDLAAHPSEEFDIEEHPDENLTQSCANYTNDNSTVFTRDGKLVLKVASACEGGVCLNSGRVMSKSSYKYGLFTFSVKVPKCNYIWPALWLLPHNVSGYGSYGQWPCSGEIDVLETVHDQNYGAFNLVAGYGSTGGCAPSAKTACNECIPGYCTSSTMNPMDTFSYYVEEANCKAEHPSWEEHLFVLNWQRDELTAWVDPALSYDAGGHLVGVTPKASPAGSGGRPTWKSYRRPETQTWLAVQDFMDQCFAGKAAPDAPFDDRFKIVLNIAIGGYGGAACRWGSSTCQTACGGAVGSEMIVSDISVWERAVSPVFAATGPRQTEVVHRHEGAPAAAAAAPRTS